VSLAVKLATCAKLLGMYFELLVLPLELSADYDYNQIPLATDWLEATSLVPVLAAFALFAAAVWAYRAHPPVFFGSAFLLVSVLPLAFLLPFFTIVLAERYLYLPSLGLCIAVGALAVRIPRRWTTASMVALVVLIILPAVARTLVRNRDWRDNETLFAATVLTAPNSSKAHANRAATLAARAETERGAGDSESARQLFEQATSHYQRALEIDPLAAHVRVQYGLCLGALGRYELAERELLKAAHQGRGEALFYLYRSLIEQGLRVVATSPMRAQRFHDRARDLLRDSIGPAIPSEAAARMLAELDDLERALVAARAGSSAPP
jgi:tetratricopeptide (TPR) repeat protein